jgi:hypothetical protein
MKLTGVRNAFQEPLDSIISKRKVAMSKYKTLKKVATTEREKFGKRLMQARAKERGTTIAAQEQQLKNAFGQRKLAQCVKRLTGKQRGVHLRSVDAPHDRDSEQRIECDDKTSIEKAFIEEGTRPFSQTNNGPLMQRDFVSRVGYQAAWFSLQFCVMKSLEYPLMATSVSKVQCNKIMKPIRAAALPALGINRHLSLTIVHGPQRFQGVGIPDLWTVQGILKFWLAIQHGDALTITGNQLRASMELHTMELGLPGHLFQHSYKTFRHLATTSWLKHLWEFCDDSNIQLLTTTPKLTLAREHDQFLIATFARFGYHNKCPDQLNLCQLFCHATRLSDISTRDGQRIHPRSWDGHPTDTSGTDYSWVTHGCPNKPAWDLWRPALRECFLLLQLTQQPLRNPLGLWTKPPTIKWNWFYSPSHDRVYKRLTEAEKFQMFSIIPNCRRLRSPSYHPIKTCDQLPIDAQRTTISEHGTFVRCHGSQPPTPLPTLPLTLAALIQPQDQWTISKFHCPENGQTIATVL